MKQLIVIFLLIISGQALAAKDTEATKDLLFYLQSKDLKSAMKLIKQVKKEGNMFDNSLLTKGNMNLGHDSVVFGTPEMIKQLAKMGVDYSDHGAVTFTPLDLASEQSIDMLKAVLSTGVDINLVSPLDHKQATAIVMAVVMRKHENAIYMLERGANANAIHPYTGWPLMVYALREESEPLMKALAKHGAKLDWKDVEGQSYQDIARALNKPKALKILKSLGAK